MSAAGLFLVNERWRNVRSVFWAASTRGARSVTTGPFIWQALMRQRLQAFLPIVLIALMVQILAPIGAAWAAALVKADPLRGVEICHSQPVPSQRMTSRAASLAPRPARCVVRRSRPRWMGRTCRPSMFPDVTRSMSSGGRPPRTSRPRKALPTHRPEHRLSCEAWPRAAAAVSRNIRFCFCRLPSPLGGLTRAKARSRRIATTTERILT